MTIEEFKESVEVLKDKENMDINFMNKGDKFPWSDFEKEKIAIEIEKLLDKFYDKDDIPYNYTHNGVKKYVNISNENKQWMEATFAKHPNYDPKTHTIRLTREFSRIQDSEVIENFLSFLIDKIRIKIAEENEVVKPKVYENKEEIFNQYYTLGNIKNAFSCFPYPKFVEYLGHDYLYWREKYNTIADKRNEIIDFDNSTVSLLGEGRLIWVSCDVYNEHIAIQKIINSFRDNRNQDNGRITPSFIDMVTNIKRNYRCSVDFMDIIHPVVGQKVSTIIKKIAMHYGIDKYTEEKTIEWVDSNTGEVKSKTKNVGWNYRFTQFCDKVKPFKKKMQVVISLNPIDYLTMSFGYKWSSCQTIDKTNERGNDNNYEGCYSGGTVELGEDESTVVVYLLDENNKIETPYLDDKIKRCLFFMGEDKFVESRVYPDGRDGSDYTDVSKQLRIIMEEVLDECNNSDNISKEDSWEEKIKENSGMLYINSKVMNAYRDFNEYPDIYSVRKKGYNEFKHINIGGKCTCLNCGGSNYREESIICGDCYGGESSETFAVCNRCGAGIGEYDDYEYIEGEYYCCTDCAMAAGYVWCDYAERWVYEDDAFYDDYDGNYYLYEDGIKMSDGNWFGSEYNAMQYGYYHCEHCDRWVVEDEWNSELDCCTDCEKDLLEEMKEEEVA